MTINGALLWYAKFIRENYAIIIIATLLMALIVGLVSSGPGRFIQQFNVLLIVVMIGAMGFTITFKSLGAAAKDWRGLSLALVLNFLFAPFLCWLLAALFLTDQPGFAVGLILIGAVPCAGMAMVWAGLLKGDVPLATVINAVTMILAPFIIPLIMLFFAGRFVVIDTGAMFIQILSTVLVPLLAGVTIREILERRTRAVKGMHDTTVSPHVPQKKTGIQELLPIMPAISATMAVLLMFMAINTSVPLIMKNLASLVPLIVSTILIFPLLFLVSYVIGMRFFPRGKNIAITYSSGMKNLPIAIGIAAISFGGLEMLPVAVGFAFQMLTAVVFYQIFTRASPGSDNNP